MKTKKRVYLSVDECNVWYRARHGAHLDGSGKIANLAQIVNVIAPILTRGEGASLQVRVEGPGYVSQKYGSVTTLDARAIPKGDRLSVCLASRSLEESMELKIDLADRKVVAGTDPQAENTYENPSAGFDDASTKDGVATLRLPPLSVVAATFRLA